MFVNLAMHHMEKMIGEFYICIIIPQNLHSYTLYTYEVWNYFCMVNCVNSTSEVMQRVTRCKETPNVYHRFLL